MGPDSRMRFYPYASRNLIYLELMTCMLDHIYQRDVGGSGVFILE
jgi:hypothetical protein